MGRPTGRRKDSAWSHFREKIPSDTCRYRRALCRYCGHDMVGSVKRMNIHLLDETSGIMFTGSCLAHQSNLLIKDVLKLDVVSSTIEKITVVASFVRKSIALREAICTYLKKSSIPMWLPSVSRWYSFATTISQVIALRDSICVVFIQDRQKPYLKTPNVEHIRALITDESFWDAANQLHSLLQPYSVVTGLSELEKPSTGLILASWVWLRNSICATNLLSDREKEDVVGRMRSRVHKYICDHQLVSWMLDPRVRGCGLSPSGKRYVRDVAIRLYREICPSDTSNMDSLIQQWQYFSQKKGTFAADSTIWSKFIMQDPHGFWRDVESEAPQLANLAKFVLGCYPHVAACERNWSIASDTITKKRNRLDSSRFEMMLIIKHHVQRTAQSTQHRSRSSKKVLDSLCSTPNQQGDSLLGDVPGTSSSDDVVSLLELSDEESESSSLIPTAPDSLDESQDEEENDQDDEETFARVREMVATWEDDLTGEFHDGFSFQQQNLDENCQDQLVNLLSYVF